MKISGHFHLARFRALLVFFRYNLDTNCDVLNEVVSSAYVLDCDESKEFAS